MTDAAALAAKGAPHGTTVVAEVQTAGIGRHGHSWHSEDRGGLYLSIVLRIPGAIPALTLALGIAVQEAVLEVTGITADLRWPNDVMINERKAAGILVQAVDGALVAGIGLNVNQQFFPPDLREMATSLRMESGQPWSMETMLQRVRTLSLHHTQLSLAEIRWRFEECSSYARGKAVEVDGVTGVTVGLDSSGFLLVQTATGVRTITAGGVRPVR